MYAAIAFSVGLTVDLFYRRRQWGARVPESGPVLLIANHPNALADPALLLRVTSREIRSLAKEPLFRMPVIQWLVKGARAIPVYRAKDGHDTSKNTEVFRAVTEALAQGDVVALFPEGISHDQPGLQPLKTGAARMVMDALQQGGEAARLAVVPVGLTYRDKPQFRSDAYVHIGEPIAARAVVDDLTARGIDPVDGLTALFDERLRALTIDLTRVDDAPLVDLIALFRRGSVDPEETVRVANAARALSTRDPAHHARVRAAVQAFAEMLAARGLDAAHLDVQPTLPTLAWYVARHSFALVVGLPIALVGALAYGAPYLFLRVLPRVMRSPPDVVATVRILGGLFVFPVWQVALSIALALTLSTTSAIFFSVALPFAALYAHAHVFRRRRMVKDAVAFVRLALRPSERKALLAARAALVEELAGVERVLGA